MEIRIVWRKFARLACSGFVFILSGCVIIPIHQTEVRNLPDELGVKLSVGDTREKVRNILGEPLIDARSLGLEVYRQSGSDIGIALIPIPIPGPINERVMVKIVVLYDETDKVKEIGAYATNLRESVGGYRFIDYEYDSIGKLDSLLGPPVSWDELTQLSVPKDKCSLVLLMGECPMEIVSLDNRQIIDLSPAGIECGLAGSKYFSAFVKKDITPGTHRLLVRQTTQVEESDFDSVFDCASGEAIYVELDASIVRHAHWWTPSFELEGDLVISKTLPRTRKQIERTQGLSQILWHNGRWYGPPQVNLSE